MRFASTSLGQQGGSLTDDHLCGDIRRLGAQHPGLGPGMDGACRLSAVSRKPRSEKPSTSASFEPKLVGARRGAASGTL
jgi:hypothetical protein